MKVFRVLRPQELTNLAFLFVAGLSFWLSMTWLLPVLPSYVEEVSRGEVQVALGGFSLFLSVQSQVGIVMGCFAIGLLLSRTRLGQMADRRGRKIVVLIGTLVAGIAPFGYLFLHSIPLLMILRAFHGVSIAAFTTGYTALVVDLSPLEKRGELIGYMSLVVPVGMAVGPALGGYMEATAGYSTVFLGAGISGLSAFVLASQVQEGGKIEPARENNSARSHSQGTFWSLLANPAFRIPTIVMLFAGLIFGSLITFLPLFVRSIGVDLNVGLFYTAAAIASFVGRLTTGQASDRYGRGLFISISLLSYGFSMFVLAGANRPPDFLLAAILEGFGGGVLIPMAIALMSDRSPVQQRGLVYAICIGGFDLGMAIAGPILGFVAASRGYSELYNLSGGMALFALVIFLTQSSKTLSHSFRFATGRGKDVYALEE